MYMNVMDCARVCLQRSAKELGVIYIGLHDSGSVKAQVCVKAICIRFSAL